MEPTIMDGDTVIVRKQDYIESGQIAIVLIDGEDATAKEVKETPEGVVLIGHNATVYQPHFYSRQEIQELPVQIIGRVVQSIRKF
jgi:repressor LexA